MTLMTSFIYQLMCYYMYISVKMVWNKNNNVILEIMNSIAAQKGAAVRRGKVHEGN